VYSIYAAKFQKDTRLEPQNAASMQICNSYSKEGVSRMEFTEPDPSRKSPSIKVQIGLRRPELFPSTRKDTSFYRLLHCHEGKD
jgi:hypothetical protein